MFRISSKRSAETLGEMPTTSTKPAKIPVTITPPNLECVRASIGCGKRVLHELKKEDLTADQLASALKQAKTATDNIMRIVKVTLFRHKAIHATNPSEQRRATRHADQIEESVQKILTEDSEKDDDVSVSSLASEETSGEEMEDLLTDAIRKGEKILTKLTGARRLPPPSLTLRSTPPLTEHHLEEGKKEAYLAAKEEDKLHCKKAIQNFHGLFIVQVHKSIQTELKKEQKAHPDLLVLDSHVLMSVVECMEHMFYDPSITSQADRESILAYVLDNLEELEWDEVKKSLADKKEDLIRKKTLSPSPSWFDVTEALFKEKAPIDTLRYQASVFLNQMIAVSKELFSMNWSNWQAICAPKDPNVCIPGYTNLIQKVKELEQLERVIHVQKSMLFSDPAYIMALEETRVALQKEITSLQVTITVALLVEEKWSEPDVMREHVRKTLSSIEKPTDPRFILKQKWERAELFFSRHSLSK